MMLFNFHNKKLQNAKYIINHCVRSFRMTSLLMIIFSAVTIMMAIYISTFYNKYQNPREATSRSRIFLFSLVYACIVASWPNQNCYRPELWYTRSPRPHLKTNYLFFFEKMNVRAACLEKLTCHVNDPHISTITLFVYFLCLYLLFLYVFL